MNKRNLIALIIFIISTINIYGQEPKIAPKESKYEYNIDTSGYSYYRGRIKDIGFFIKLSTNDYENYFERGVLLMRLEKYNEALSDIDKAFSLNPNDDNLVYVKKNLQAILNIKKWVKERTDKDDHYEPIFFSDFFEQPETKSIEEKIKTNKKIKYSLAHTYKINDSLFEGTYFHFDEKINVIGMLTFNEMLEITMTGIPLDSVYSETPEQRIERATIDLEKNPDDWHNFLIRAGARDQTEDIEGAISDYEKALELIPDEQNYYYEEFPLVYTNLGDLYFQKGDETKALDFFDKAIEYNPKYAIAYFHRGKRKCELEIDDYGCEDLKKAIELDDYYKEYISKQELNLNNCCEKAK